MNIWRNFNNNIRLLWTGRFSWSYFVMAIGTPNLEPCAQKSHPTVICNSSTHLHSSENIEATLLFHDYTTHKSRVAMANRSIQKYRLSSQRILPRRGKMCWESSLSLKKTYSVCTFRLSTWRYGTISLHQLIIVFKEKQKTQTIISYQENVRESRQIRQKCQIDVGSPGTVDNPTATFGDNDCYQAIETLVQAVKPKYSIAKLIIAVDQVRILGGNDDILELLLYHRPIVLTALRVHKSSCRWYDTISLNELIIVVKEKQKRGTLVRHQDNMSSEIGQKWIEFSSEDDGNHSCDSRLKETREENMNC